MILKVHLLLDEAQLVEIVHFGGNALIQFSRLRFQVVMQVFIVW